MNDLERALYSNDADWPLGIDVHGDEHENPNQPRRPIKTTAPTLEEQARRRAFDEQWMRDNWGVSHDAR